MRKLLAVALVFAVAVVLWRRESPAPELPAGTPTATVPASDEAPRLPSGVDDTLRRIAAGGPFAHPQDGTVFGNYEGLLPQRPRGYYHEYTVETPRARDRGARRIITGGDPPVVYYYTDDHYRSFRRFAWQP